MVREDKFVTLSLAASLSNVKLSAVTGMPQGARVVLITARTNTNSSVIVHVGNGTNTVLLHAGQGGSGSKVELDTKRGMPIEWGQGADDALYVTTGSALQDGTITVATDNY